jgi:hypothetical protein
LVISEPDLNFMIDGDQASLAFPLGVASEVQRELFKMSLLSDTVCLAARWLSRVVQAAVALSHDDAIVCSCSLRGSDVPVQVRLGGRHGCIFIPRGLTPAHPCDIALRNAQVDSLVLDVGDG